MIDSFYSYHVLRIEASIDSFSLVFHDTDEQSRGKQSHCAFRTRIVEIAPGFFFLPNLNNIISKGLNQSIKTMSS